MKKTLKTVGTVFEMLWEVVGFVFVGKDYYLNRYTKEELDEMGINFDYN